MLTEQRLWICCCCFDAASPLLLFLSLLCFSASLLLCFYDDAVLGLNVNELRLTVNLIQIIAVGSRRRHRLLQHYDHCKLLTPQRSASVLCASYGGYLWNERPLPRPCTSSSTNQLPTRNLVQTHTEEFASESACFN